MFPEQISPDTMLETGTVNPVIGNYNWCLICHVLNPSYREDCRYCFEATSLILRLEE